MRGKTIQVFLTNGTPSGLKVADITSNIEQAFFIPRSKLDQAKNRDELKQPGVYFLFGSEDDTVKPVAYIGQSKNCIHRLKQHDQKKEFWSHAVAFISKTNSFSQTHIEYLEQLAINKAYDANRYAIVNGMTPTQVDIAETLEADLLDNFDTIDILLSTLGFPLFDPIKSKTPVVKSKVFYCKGREYSGSGEFTGDGFVVYKDSIAKRNYNPTFNTSSISLRNRLIESGLIIEHGDSYKFSEDFLFNSPSSAASQICGFNANGWERWVNSDGVNLSDVYRK